MNNYLTGKPIDRRELKDYIGRQIQYLLERDIDKSGRGYYKPRIGTVDEIYNRQIVFDGDWMPIKSIREFAEIED